MNNLIPELILCVVSLLLTAMYARSRQQLALSERLRLTAERERCDAQETCNRAVSQSTQLIEELTEAREQLAKAQKLASTHMAMNEQFSQQTSEAWDMYRKSGIRASNAQSMMLKEIDKLVRAVNGYRKKLGDPEIQMNKGFQKVYDDFYRDHVQEGT